MLEAVVEVLAAAEVLVDPVLDVVVADANFVSRHSFHFEKKAYKFLMLMTSCFR